MTTNSSPSTFDINSLLIAGETVLWEEVSARDSSNCFPLGSLVLFLITAVVFMGISVVILQTISIFLLHPPSVVEIPKLVGISCLFLFLLVTYSVMPTTTKRITDWVNTNGIKPFYSLIFIVVLYLIQSISQAQKTHNDFLVIAYSIGLVVIGILLLKNYYTLKDQEKLNQPKIYWTNFRLIQVDSSYSQTSYFFKNFNFIGLDQTKLTYSIGQSVRFLKKDSVPTELYKWLAHYIIHDNVESFDTYYKPSQPANSIKSKTKRIKSVHLLKRCKR